MRLFYVSIIGKAMFTMTITPRFSETDGLGHINNTVVPVWFEAAREPIFQIFNPEMDLSKWNLIIAKIEVSYLAQLHYPQKLEITTEIAKLGNSSMTILQQVYQGDKKVASGECVMVKFDYQTNSSIKMTEQEKQTLSLHLING